LDDFGINNSNYLILFEIDIDYIKIAGKFIQNLDKKNYYKKVKGLTALAKSSDIKVIAELIDNKEIEKLVKEIGIDYSQGYYIGKPKETI